MAESYERLKERRRHHPLAIPALGRPIPPYPPLGFPQELWNAWVNTSESEKIAFMKTFGLQSDPALWGIDPRPLGVPE
jgi:hypothetical protein